MSTSNIAKVFLAAILIVGASCSDAAKAENYPNPEPLKIWAAEGHNGTFEGLNMP